MVSLVSLWLPVLLGAVAVFFVSSLVHMVFRWHRNDYRKLPNEDEVRAAIRASGVAPGEYSLPHCEGPKEAQRPEIQQKFRDGPVAVLRVLPTGVPAMGRMLGQWFSLSLGVALLTAYAAAHSLAPGAPPMTVLRVTATIGFLAYSAGTVSEAIWMGKPWTSIPKYLLDAVLYAFAAAAPLALLWPGPV